MVTTLAERLAEGSDSWADQSPDLIPLVEALQDGLGSSEVHYAEACQQLLLDGERHAVIAVTSSSFGWVAEPDGDKPSPSAHSVLLSGLDALQAQGTTLRIRYGQGPVPGDGSGKEAVFEVTDATRVRDAVTSARSGQPSVANQRGRDDLAGRSARTSLDQPLTAELYGCVVLAGSGPYPVAIGEKVHLRFHAGALTVATNEGPILGPTPYEELLDLTLGGQGETTSGGGFFGGGFGLEGALTGMAIASVANALTTTRSIESIIHLELVDGEVFILNEKMTPAALRLALSEVFVAIRLARDNETQGQPSTQQL